MSQYIEISTPNDPSYMRNIALSRILSFMGEQYRKTHRGIFVQSSSDYKLGLHYIDQRCKRLHKRAIRFLINSKKDSENRNWKIHKRKAERFFRILHQELKNANAPQEITDLFDYLYNDISRNLSLDRNGSQIVAYPYLAEFNQVVVGNRYTHEERKAISRVVRAINEYDDIYKER